MSEVESERPLRPLRIPPRAAATALGVFALLAPFTDSYGLVAAVLAAPAGVLVGEGLAWSRLRTGPAAVLAVLVALVGTALSRILVGFTVFSTMLGPSTALVLGSVVGLGLGVTGAVGALRLLARRVPTLQTAELAAFALATAAAFAAHRDGALARPLWLTDRAWQLGVDPGSVLLAIGALAACLIGLLQLLETRHRLPWLSWLWLPVIALFAFLLSDVATSERPESPELDAIKSAMDRPPEARGDEASESGESGSSDGSAKPEPAELGEDGQPVKPELGEDGQPVKPELGEDGLPVQPEPGDGSAKPELGEDGQPVKPELGPDGQPVKPEQGEGPEARPEQGDGTADAGDDGGEPQSGDDGGKPESGDDGGKPESGDDGGKPESGDDGGKPESGDDGGKPESGDDGGKPESGDDPSESEEPPPEPPKEQPDLEDDQGTRSQSNQPVAVVILGDDYTPQAGYFYLRQQAASEFVGTRLVPAQRSDVDLDVPDRFPTATTTVEAPPPEEGHKRVHGKVTITAEHDGPFALQAPIELSPAYNPNPARFLRAWEFVSHAPVTPYEELVGHTAGSEMSAEVLAHYLAFPTDDPRYQELADSLVAQLPEELRDDPFAKAVVIKQHLDQMAYDTSERHAGAEDPTAEFLFEGDEMVGYCVHAAHASAYLLRAAGVPARVGTGYAIEEERRRGSALVVLSKDAHAWPELYLDGVGWTILDIAPAENRDPEGQPLDEEMADLLADMAREEPETDPEGGFDWRGLWHATVRTLGNAAIVLVAAILVLHYLIKLWRRGRPYVATSRGIARVGYRAALDRLAEAGLVREDGETRERFARRVAEVSPSFVALTQLHLAAAFGAPDRPEPRSTKTWLRLLSQVHRELSAGTGFARWLGVMNPFSFYRSR
ncbi:MAG: DUF4129 domain-containing protein [Deltaproteobacteria bacterium]|nr:MAG: DUF4129 domain-containing protein [Deltaproteobacteria bacterium]